jgi:uncharacterized protein YndB with AHSA1/START domain
MLLIPLSNLKVTNMSKSIHHKFFYPHSCDVVWEYLTKPELIAQWLMVNDFQAVVGHDFQFKTKPIPNLDLDGIFHCKVLEIVPLKKLSYSWQAGPGNGKMSLDTIVVWRLIEKDNGTELQLVHSGFKEVENFAIYSGMMEGWLKNMQKMAAQLNVIKDGTAKV